MTMAPPKPPTMADAENVQMPNMLPMLAMMFLVLALYMVDGNDHLIGGALNYALFVVDFGGQYPVATLMLAGTLMILFSTLLRTFMTDTIEQAKSQSIMSAFNKELRQARLENNLYKVKKLTEMQPAMMSKSMAATSKNMKAMPYTMIIIIPMFLWLRYFVDVTVRNAGTAIVNIPWSVAGVSLSHTFWIIPAWILVYTLISIPLGQIIARMIRTYQFRKKLEELEGPEVIEAV